MPWSSFPFVRIIFAFMIGVLFYTYTSVSSVYSLASIACFSVIYFAVFFFFNPAQRRKYHFVFGALSTFIFISLGMALTHEKTAIIKPTHFSTISDSVNYYEGVINEEVQEKTKTWNTEISIKRIFTGGKWHAAEGLVLWYIKKIDKSESVLKYGDVIVIKGSPQPVQAPFNPQSFDFRQYLAYQQIYHQHFVELHQFKIIGNQVPNPIYHLALRLRKKADASLRKFIIGAQEYAIITALVLGVKDHLDNEIRSAYSNTGAMHVLAVSGLHVGILFQILSWLLGGLKRKKGSGKWIFLCIVLGVLWFYAFITGLSPSVLRAVIMFSMVALAGVIDRNSNIYNTIAFSALLILAYDPYLLFSVSFQLSYLAVLGIIYFHPKIDGLVHWEDRFPTMYTWGFGMLKFVWSIMCVSMAAQLGTFPVGLYYFHQFPVYFLLSNLVVIPLATFLFSGGLAIIFIDFIPFSFLNYLKIGIGMGTQMLVTFQNWLLFGIDHLPFSVINGISISLWETLAIYLIIILFALLFAFRKFFYLVIASALTLVLGIGQFVEFFEEQKQTSFYVFHINKSLNINLLSGNKDILIADSTLLYDDVKIRNQFYNYWAYKGIVPHHVEYLNMSDLDEVKNQNFASKKDAAFLLFAYQGKQILWVHQKTKQQLPAADYLLISNNAIRNLKNLGKYPQIIIDASNSRYNATQLARQAQVLGVPLHNLHTQGAFVYEFLR